MADICKPSFGMAESVSAVGDETTTFIVFIKGGPVRNLSSHMQYQAESLARVFRGVIFAWGLPQEAVFGSMKIVCQPLRGMTMASKLAYMARLFIRASQEIRESHTRPVIIANDPLRTGLVGLALKYRTGSPLICQLNGVHTDADLHLDGPNRLVDRFRRKLVPIVARFVLNRCDGIRPMFPGHLDGYKIKVNGQVIHYYFDPTNIDRFNNAGEEKVVLFVGTPFLLKGVDLLLEAYQSVRAEFPDWRLVLVGNFAQRVTETVDDLAGIEVLRPMPNEEIATLMCRCGIFVLPSRTEGIPRVLLEAGAAGKPRIASRVGGIPTMIEDGVDGLLFPKGDARSLATQLRRLMASQEDRKRLGEAAAERVRREYSSERFLQHFNAHVNEVLRVRAKG